MNKKILVALVVVVLVGLVVAGIILSVKIPQSLTKEEKTEITTLVEGFGKKLVSVDKLAPDEDIAKSIKENYSPFLSDNLILEWTFDPSKALGRVVSSPWPDRIEILSMKKLDAYTVKVNGYVVWVASGGLNKLEVTEKVPTVLIVRKDPSTQKLSIDNVYSNEFAFYDGKVLLKTLKKAFPGMYYIGERYEPYVQMVMYIGGISSKPVAVVDMGTGGAYTEYYTICLSTNGHLEVTNFKDKDGKIAPLFFDEGASVKHEARVNFENDSKSNLVMYQSVVDRDDNGKLVNIEVDAYVWNDKTKMFEYSKELSEGIKKDLEGKLAANTIALSSLKYKEIKSEFPAIGAVAIYRDNIAFSCGTGVQEPNLPGSASINHISIYDVKTGQITTLEVTKAWANIDQIEMNDNWILFREVEGFVGVPSECFAIDRKTNKMQLVVPTDFLGNYVAVNNIALLGDDAFVSVNVFEKKGTPKEIFATRLSLGEKLIKVNLKTREASTIFDGTKEQMHISTLQSVKDSIVYLVEPTSSSKETEKNLYVYKDGVSVKISAYTVQLIDSFRGSKDDSFIIFVINSKDAFAYLSNLNAYNYIFADSNILGIAVGSKNYFVSQETDTTAKSSFSMPIDLYSKIYVLNRATGKIHIIKLDYYLFNLSIYGDELCFMKYQSGEGDSIIYLGLKENGF